MPRPPPAALPLLAVTARRHLYCCCINRWLWPLRRCRIALPFTPLLLLPPPLSKGAMACRNGCTSRITTFLTGPRARPLSRLAERITVPSSTLQRRACVESWRSAWIHTLAVDDGRAARAQPHRRRYLWSAAASDFFCQRIFAYYGR
jgi:hypothetical protein